MTRDYVESSSLQSVGYDEQSQTLEVEFCNGAVYQYYNCPRLVYDELMNSASKGQFFNSQIRNGLPYSRV